MQCIILVSVSHFVLAYWFGDILTRCNSYFTTESRSSQCDENKSYHCECDIGSGSCAIKIWRSDFIAIKIVHVIFLICIVVVSWKTPVVECGLFLTQRPRAQTTTCTSLIERIAARQEVRKRFNLAWNGIKTNIFYFSFICLVPQDSTGGYT